MAARAAGSRSGTALAGLGAAALLVAAVVAGCVAGTSAPAAGSGGSTLEPSSPPVAGTGLVASTPVPVAAPGGASVASPAGGADQTMPPALAGPSSLAAPPLPIPVEPPIPGMASSFPATVARLQTFPAGPPPAGFVLRVPVLMYHRIASSAQRGRSLPGLVVSPAAFAAQMQAFARAGWHTITAGALAADLVVGRTPPPRTFVVTFDDGHEDGYTNAFPVLRRLGFVATFYVITGRIGRPGDLSLAELRTLAAAGMEIGSHTASHATLTRLRPFAVDAQLARSEAAIAGVLGAPPITFAYPRGKWDQAVAADVASAGYAVAFTERPGCALSAADRFAAPRLRVGPWTTPAALLAKAAACGG